MQLDCQARHDNDPPVTGRVESGHKARLHGALRPRESSPRPKIAVIQDGSVLESAMKTALNSALAKSAAGATLSKVTIEHGTACKNELCQARAPR